MTKFLLKVFVLLLLSNAVTASERNEYQISIPESYDVEEYKNDLIQWRKSLINGVGYNGDTITEIVFLKTSIFAVINGKEVTGAVFQNKDNKNQFYISGPRNTIVDFSVQKVGSMGVSGITSHPTPSGRMIVVLAPSRGVNILGVTLDFAVKTQVRKPLFEKHNVSYQW